MFSAGKITSSSAVYQIERSLRFNDNDSAYLNKTYGAAGNRKTWTKSVWLKLGNLGTSAYITGSNNAGSNDWDFLIQTGGGFQVYSQVSASLKINLKTTPLYRDPTAWMHVVLAVDTTQATASNRAKLYVNGTQVTVFSLATYPSQNDDLIWNSTNPLYIGSRAGASGDFWDGYMTEFNFIDGQALTPSSFGQTNSTTGTWDPKAYTGSFGTNGFYLKFADNSGTTAATLGKDSSGNGNNWTPNNFSVTAGSGNDSLTDTPTNYGTDTGVGGEVRGNYAVLSSLDKNASVTLTNGGLDAAVSAVGNNRGVRGTFPVQSGLFYFEATISTLSNSGDNISVGVASTTAQLSNGVIIGDLAQGWALYGEKGSVNFLKANNGSYTAQGGTATPDVNRVIGVALNRTTQKIWFAINNTWTGSGDPAAGTNAAFSNVSVDVVPAFSANGGAVSFNFGQRPFTYTAPSGFKALCTQNITTSTVVKPSTAFIPKVYTGTGASLSITGLNFGPELVWIKSRSAATDNTVYDAQRGVQKRLETNNTDAEVTSDGGLTSFDSAGFTLSTLAQVNTNAATYVAWCWEEGATYGFDIVLAGPHSTTGTTTISHGLGATPHMFIGKVRDGLGGWAVYHRSLSANYTIYLNMTDAAAAYTGYFTNVGSTTFDSVNWNWSFGSNKSAVFYLWTSIAGFSSFSSYTGNGSADGPVLSMGFRPAFVGVKNASATANWLIWDNNFQGYNVDSQNLHPNLSNAQGGGGVLDWLAIGAKYRHTDSTNTSGNTIIWWAFANQNFKNARAA